MKRFALAAIFHTRRFAVVTVLALAALLLVARALVPFAEGLRGELATHLGDLLGMRVEVGALTVRLEGWSPRLTLTDVKLSDRLSDQAEFSVRELRLDLDLLSTWGARRLRIEGLTLVGADFELRRDAEGRLLISGLQGLGGGKDPGALKFFLREGHFALTDSRLYWTDNFTGAATIVVNIDQLLVVNREQQHLLRLEAQLAADADTRVGARGRLRGAADDLSSWSGELYVRLDSRQDQIPLLQSRLPRGLGLQLSGLRVETWSQLDSGQPVEVLARLRADALQIEREPGEINAAAANAPAANAAATPAAAWELEGVSGLLQWSRHGASSRLRLADLRARGFGSSPLSIGLLLAPLADASDVTKTASGAADADSGTSANGAQAPSGATASALPATAAPATRHLLGGMGDMDLAVLLRLARLVVPERLAELPGNLALESTQGRLERLVFSLDLPSTGFVPARWRVKGALNGIGIEPKSGRPGVHGLALEFDAEPQRGFADADMRYGVLDLRPQLAEPTPVRRLSAQLGWRIEPAGSLRLQVPDFRLSTPDLGAVLDAELCLHPSASPYVDLHLQLTDADASAIGRYLPVRVLDPPLVDWLNRAVRGGRVTKGDFLLSGDMGYFPFDDSQGRFVMDLEIEDATLDYSAPAPDKHPKPRWPALEGLDAEVRIVNRRLDITASSGRFLDSELLEGSASMPNLWQPERIIIKARGQGPFTDGRLILLESPLEPQLGWLGRAFAVEGELGIALELGVPFSRDAEVDYKGALQWSTQASARFDPGEGLEPLALNDIQGQLDFSNDGVEAQGIKARLGEQPIVVNVSTLPADAQNAAARTRVEIQGQAPLTVLSQAFPSPFWDLVTGDPHWQFAIDLSNQDFANASAPINLALSSDLKGVSLNLPPPLGKAAEAQMPVRLDTQLIGQSLTQPALRLGPLRARLALNQTSGKPPALQSAAIAFNAEPPAPPGARGLSLSGRLPSLDLGLWLDWWQANGDRLGQGDQTFAVRSDGIEIGRLSLGELQFRDLTAAFAPTSDGGMQVRFRASDNAGTLGLPPAGSGAPVRLELANWRLENPVAKSPGAAPATTPKPAREMIDPRRLGPLVISIDALEWGEYPLGHFAVRLVPDKSGVSFQDMELAGPLIQAKGQGTWRANPIGGYTTALKLAINSPNGGDLLRELKLYQGLDGSQADITADLQWLGDPGAFGPASVAGEVQVDFKAGRLLDVDPGVGRVLGFLNPAAIQRRLRLDFRDVTDEGFDFDSATGEFTLEEGIARILRFELLSSTADIRIQGASNLIEETFDQTVMVTPKVGSGVALASAVAGGPLVGAAVLLADTVAGGAVDRLTQHQYKITGPWREPKVESLGMTADDAAKRAVSDAAAGIAHEAGLGTWSGRGSQADKASTAPPKASVRPQASEPENLFLDNF
ncbi:MULTISPECIES: YhdP family protein [Thiorhodovibrio]|uniref:YhdP family protein n=1 Tax=Thiorhodovibrio TaxID=61593 RepID=UPI0019136CBC|nr:MULTISPECIES: YhdP family protein [Thiorhodovibrio]MBK5969890.1 TIGR02099 family protein [Thiorhodovibrio winogradskyi]WPL12065.1 hypothetical protein Thiosp_01820 [Thiorhodovibrio litoralis]